MLKYLEEEKINSNSMVIYNDLFGFLSCALNKLSPITIVETKSQENAIQQNYLFNKIPFISERFLNPLSEIPSKVELGLIKIPKSLELFRLFLYQLSKCLTDDSTVICGFMTRHFSNQMITIAEEFFESVEQSKAWKKSRLLILKKKKGFQEIDSLNSIKLNDSEIIKQYFGVFSANNIDYATQFLLENLQINTNENKILDLGCGNGVIGYSARKIKNDCEIHLLDDSFLAVESSKLNLGINNTCFHYNDNLNDFADEFFDLVISNPPFHFGHETNIEVTLDLFQQVNRCLKNKSRFLLVANKHLNYKTHLIKIFDNVITINENDKFIIYNCIK